MIPLLRHNHHANKKVSALVRVIQFRGLSSLPHDRLAACSVDIDVGDGKDALPRNVTRVVDSIML